MRTLSRVEIKPEMEVSKAQLAFWLLYAPGFSPAWDHYMISVVHLRPVDDEPPVKLHYPSAEYEILVAALDPRPNPVVDNPRTWRSLGVNYVEQFDGVTDELAILVAKNVAELLTQGSLYVEPVGIRGAREMFRVTLKEIVGKVKRGEIEHEEIRDRSNL